MIGGHMKQLLKVFMLISVLITMPACSISFDLTATPTPNAPTVEAIPFLTAEPTDAESVPTLEPTTAETITVYFTDQAKFAVGTLPFEVAVLRPLPEGADPVRAVLDAFFAGPTAEETAQGLVLVSSGFTGVREYSLVNGIAHIHLEGTCANNGAAYSVASVIARNLEQFPKITAYKIYDENDDNLDPDSAMSSLPYCLEP